MDKTYFIYRYVRHDKNVPFYVGKGTKQYFTSAGYPLYSYRSIYGRAFSKDRNKTCLGIMNKTSYDVEVLYETNDFNEIENKEKEFISLYGIIYDNTGTLTNLTRGGTSFKTTQEYISNHHFACERKGVEFSNKKKVYMYGLDGKFIEKFDTMNGFSKKYGLGHNSKAYLGEAVRRKVSYKGYFFSMGYYEKLDLNIYKSIDLFRMPIVKYNGTIPIEIFKSSGDASKSAGVAQCTMVHAAKLGKSIKGFTYKRVKIHELPKIG